MLTTSRTRQKFGPVILSVVLTMVLWLGSKWYFGDWFENPWKYPAKAASLSATVLICWCVLLSCRARLMEEYFGGLDKVYQVHKRLGRWSFFLILAHPLFLAADRLPDLPAFLGRLWFLPTGGDRYLLGHNLGVAVLLLMAVLVSVTLWVRLTYHRWKRTHEWFGLVLLGIVVHVAAVDADVAAYPLLGAWMYGSFALAAVSFVWIRFLYRRFGPRFRYRVDEIERQGDILEVSFTPEARPMDFKPSQFVYLAVRRDGISPEPHPYSIACGYNREARFKLGIKKVGDHTRSLELLAKGDPVDVYGPYGRFSDKFLAGERDCVFIGGGIGITPLLGMWHVALHSEERCAVGEAARALEKLHPEALKSWRSPKVALFYVCITADQASFDDDIRNEVILSRFHGFKAFEERGHSYELYLASRSGLISADYINGQVAGGVADKYIFLCGPSPMVTALIGQFVALGVPRDQIVTEDFNLLY